MSEEPTNPTPDDQGQEYESTPWHFKLLLLALVLYLGYRLVQLIIWGAENAF